MLGADDLDLFRDDVVLANAGHVPWEVDVEGIEGVAGVVREESYDEGITTWRLRDGRLVHLLGSGHCVVPVPPDIDALVAGAYLELARSGR